MFGKIVIARTVRKYGKAKRNVIAPSFTGTFVLEIAHRNGCASEM